MLQVAQFSSAVTAPGGLTDADLDRIRETVRTCLKAFYRMQSEIDEFVNPFAQWTHQSPPPFVCYILWCIDELPAADATAMNEQTPNLQREYNHAGTWQEIVSTVMGINRRWGSQAQRMWQRNLEAKDGPRLSPMEFAKHLIEQNFHVL